LKFFIIIVVFFIVGCTSHHSNVVKIHEYKKEKVKKSVVLIKNSTKYQAKIGDGKIEKIYIDFPSEFESIFFNKVGYAPTVPIKGSYYCGYGCLAGWLCLLIGFHNYSEENYRICHSQFSSVDGYAFIQKFGFGLLTFMTPFITGAGVYTKSFDKKKFRDFIFDSKLFLFKNDLIDKVANLKGRVEVLYVDNDFDKTLEEKYKKLLFIKEKVIGNVFVSKNSDSYSVILFKNKKNNIGMLSYQVNQILSDFSKVNLKYLDIKSLIPPKVKKPSLPPIKEFKKSEFETKEEFRKRVIDALKKRDEEIRKIKENYYMKVYRRNAYIDALQKAYINYLKDQQKESKKEIKIIKKNLPFLLRYLALEQIKFDAENFRYDAEKKKLYFNLISSFLNEKAYIVVKPNIAKTIKLQKKYKIVPDFTYENNKLILKNLKLFAFKNKKFYLIRFTNVLFKPSEIKLVSPKSTIKSLVQKEFKKYKQKPVAFKSENVLLVENINYNFIHRVPKWFINPPKDKIIGYGSGKTYKEAIANARAELAKMLEIKIKVDYYSEQKLKNFNSLKEVSQKLQQESNVKLTSKEYRIYKQTKKDGIWYIGLEYIRKDK